MIKICINVKVEIFMFLQGDSCVSVFDQCI